MMKWLKINLLMMALLAAGASRCAAQVQVSFFDFTGPLEGTFSPWSVKVWGKAPAMQKLTLRWGSLELVYLHTFKTLYHVDRVYHLYGTDVAETSEYHGSYVALFVMPVQLDAGRFRASAGAGWFFFKRFATGSGQHLNFTIQLSYMLTDRLGLMYSHISDGFGILNEFNPGVDNFSIKVTF